MTIKTILGIDYGLRRVGVAVGNTLTRNAEPLSIIQRTDDTQVIRAIEKLIREWQVNILAVGVPRHPDGTAHEMTQACLDFVAQLKNLPAITIVEVDERYTSAVVSPKSVRKANGKIRAAEQDDKAAAVILNQYFSSI